jgi:hypothetical protein
MPSTDAEMKNAMYHASGVLRIGWRAMSLTAAVTSSKLLLPSTSGARCWGSSYVLSVIAESRE